MDFVGLAGLLVALLALGISLWGIRDVREQVRRLVELERNRIFTRLLNDVVWEFVDPTDTRANVTHVKVMHESCMLTQALEPMQTTDSAQTAALNEVLVLARNLVERGLAKWKPGMDVDVVTKTVREWQVLKNSAVGLPANLDVQGLRV